jgi:amidohydrolase
MTGGEAFNVIPEAVELRGTIRSFNPEIRELVLERFQKIVSGVSEAMDCQAEADVRKITPATINDPEMAERVREVAKQVLPDAELDADERTMGSEDMAYMMDDIPGCYFFVGSANREQGLDAAHHHPKFDFDESALPRGAALMAAAVVEFLD